MDVIGLLDLTAASVQLNRSAPNANEQEEKLFEREVLLKLLPHREPDLNVVVVAREALSRDEENHCSEECMLWAL